MKPITTLGTLGSVLAISAFAFADAPAPAASAPKPPTPPPLYSALPVGTMSTPPKDKAPTRIPKTEKVEGFNVADPPKAQLHEGKFTQVLIFLKEDEAKDYTAAKGMGFGLAEDSTCFSQSSRSRFMRSSDDEAAPAEWPFEMEQTGRINANMKQPPPRKKGEKPKPFTITYEDMAVTAVHQERFVLHEDKKAHIEMVDAWVDPMTHGVRLISRTTMQLERIGSASHGVKLYAARSDKSLHVVARREKPKDKDKDGVPTTKTSSDFRLMSAMRQPLVVELPSGEHEMTQCGFAHVSLKASPGSGETAMFESSSVFVDPPEPKEKKDPASDDGSTSPFGFRMGMNGREDEPTIRVRPFRATVSSTWSSKDKDPVLSVSFGWAGREREM